MSATSYARLAGVSAVKSIWVMSASPTPIDGMPRLMPS